jgi:hypothetical protein
VIVNASCTFLIPFTYPGTIDCRMFCGHPGRSSVPTYYEMRVVGEDRIYAEGAAKLVWINPRPASRFRCPTACAPAALKEIVMSTSTARSGNPRPQRIAATRLTAFMRRPASAGIAVSPEPTIRPACAGR